MKKMKIIILVSLLLLMLLVIVFLIFQRNDIIIQKNIHDYLFEKNSNYIIKKKCYVDFIGLSIDGSVFDFYEYDIVSKNEMKVTDKHPEYEKIFFHENIKNLEFSYWKQTPINNLDSLFYFQMLQSVNLKKKECPSEFFKQKYWEKEGNFYSYIGGYTIGSYIFIYIPNDKKLFVVYKKG